MDKEYRVDRKQALSIIDQVIEGLTRQDSKSEDEASGSCRYRFKTEEGTVRRCAAGFLIKDEHYNPQMEGWTIVLEDLEKPEDPNAFLPGKALKDSGVPEEMLPVVVVLQYFHDAYDLLSTGVRKMREVRDTLASSLPFDSNMTSPSFRLVPVD